MSQLLAFESAARHGSVSRAAEELCLTQSAVSRQLRLLEAQMGTALFHRVRQRMVLTDAGRIYAVELRKALEAVVQASQKAITLGGHGEVLSLAVLPMFATRWLIPRMGGFAARCPDVTVNFATRNEPFDFKNEPFDAAIHYGDGFWPDATCHYLMAESVVPVGSPAFKRRIRSAHDLAGLTLLQQSSRPTQWAEWFDHAGVQVPHAMRGPRYEQFAMLVQAAASGLGVALVPRFLVEDDLASRRLALLSDDELVTRGAYYLVVPETGGANRLALAFRDWIVAEAASMATRAGATARRRSRRA